MKFLRVKRIWMTAVCVSLVCLMTACAGTENPAENTGDTGTEKKESSAVTKNSEEAETSGEETPGQETEAANTEAATLRLYGPGLFAAVGADGSTDLVTGIEKPGYQVVIDRWKELYPNVEVVIEAIPWDNWKAAVQTAALSGDYDILIHGNGNADFCLDLTDYIAADPEVNENLTFYPYRRNPEDMTEVRAYGLSYTLNPALCVIDKDILEHYGVAIPDASWTFDDLAEIAQACTGTDPVTGEQTYGVSMYPMSNAYKTYKVVSRGFDDVIFEFSPELKDTVVTFDNEKTVNVFDYVALLGEYSSPDYLEDLNLANAYTEKNDTALIWADDVFNIYNTIDAAGLTDRYMFLTYPAIEEGEHAGITSSNMADMNISIYKETEQKELAWEFLRFLVTDPVVQQWYIDTYSIPVNAQYTELLSSVMPAQYSDPISEVILTNPEKFDSSASVWYDSTWFGTLQSDLSNEFDQLLQGKVTSGEAVKNIQKNIDSYLQSLE